MNNRKISRNILIILSICLVVTAIASVTYALFSNDIYAANPDAYSTGILSIETSSKSENMSLTNALPMTNEEGVNSTPYVFTIKNTGNLDYEFDVKLVSTNSNTFSAQYIWLQINNGLGARLSTFTNGEILSDIVLSAGESIDISIRLWLSIDTPNSELGKGFESKIITEGQAVAKRANTLMSASGSSQKFLRSDLDKSQISSVSFVDSNVIPNTAIASFDVSYSMDGTVMMWYGEANNNGLHDVYIGSSSGKTILSSGNSLFYKLTEVTSINLSNIDTSQVTDMNIMFNGCSKLISLDVSNFNTKKVKDMQGMFYKCEALETLDLSNFDTSNVNNMYYMFAYCKGLNNLIINNFNTEKVTNMQGMFYTCQELKTLDLSSFNTRSVTNMAYMFALCLSLQSVDLSGFNTGSVTDMSYMFGSSSSVGNMAITSIGDVSKWNTSNVTNMQSMFQMCSNITVDVSNWDVSKVQNLWAMFYACASIENIDLSKWDVSSVTTLRGMFAYCTKLKTVDLSNWNTINVTDMRGTFGDCTNLTTIYVSDWKTTNVVNSEGMFANCTSLVGGAGTRYNASYIDIKYAIIDGGTSAPGYFTSKV